MRLDEDWDSHRWRRRAWLNIAVYTLTKLLERRHEVYAIFHGWRGILDREVRRVTSKDLIDLAFTGGTFIRTSRTNPFKDEARAEAFARNLRELGLDVIVAIGGDDTLSAAARRRLGAWLMWLVFRRQ